MVHFREIFGGGGKERAARHDFNARFLTPGNDSRLRRFLLDGHGPDKHIICPLKVLVFQVIHIHIDESLFPFSRKHGGNRQQAERRMKALFDMKDRAYLKLQKVSGYLGYTRSTFIIFSSSAAFLSKSQAVFRKAASRCFLIGLSCSRCRFFRDNRFADRGQCNTSQFQVLYPKRDTDNRDEVKSKPKSTCPIASQTPAKMNHITFPTVPRTGADIIFLFKFFSTDCFLAEWKECEPADNEACLTPGNADDRHIRHKPAIHQASPIHTPPRMNQRRLPIARTVFSFLSVPAFAGSTTGRSLVCHMRPVRYHVNVYTQPPCAIGDKDNNRLFHDQTVLYGLTPSTLRAI